MLKQFVGIAYSPLSASLDAKVELGDPVAERFECRESWQN
jgi:hypothetical protein